MLLWNVSSWFGIGEAPISFSEFIRWVDTGQVDRVELAGNQISGTSLSGEPFRTYAPPRYDGLANKLLERHVVVQARAATTGRWTLLYTAAPILLVIGFLVFFMRQVQSGSNPALSLGKSRAKLSSSAQRKVTFQDVAGVDEPQEELQEIIEFLREPQKFRKLGGRIPKGVLLTGPPGTGKTLLARAVAGEANVPFFSISGSDFVEMFVGVGASRVRDLFQQGQRHAPCIVFIDELDAVGRHRGAGLGGGHDRTPRGEDCRHQFHTGERRGLDARGGDNRWERVVRPQRAPPRRLYPHVFSAWFHKSHPTRDCGGARLSHTAGCPAQGYAHRGRFARRRGPASRGAIYTRDGPRPAPGPQHGTATDRAVANPSLVAQIR